MKSLLEIEADLVLPGGPFECREESVLGVPMTVFRDRLHSARSILEASRAFGDAEHLVCGETRLSFEAHLREVGSVAEALREHYGVGPGDRVAILAANCAEWVVTYWAAVSLGAIAVGLNGWWSGDEIEYGVTDCDPRVLVADRRRLERIDRTSLDVPIVEIESGFDALRNHAPGTPLATSSIAEDDPATILYTSGTTGRPKGAVITHRALVAAIRINLFHGIRMTLAAAQSPDATGSPGATPPQTCMLVSSPLFHISGLVNGAVMSLATGAKAVWLPGRFDPLHVMKTLEAERVTSWGPMGTMVYRVVNHPDVERFDFSSLRNVGSGGAPVSAELQQRMREVFPGTGSSMGIGYGLTESTSMVAVGWGAELVDAPDTVGRPLPTIDLEIRDEAGQRVPEGTEGEIHVRAPTLMREYWGRADATGEAILPGRWLRTGDWGRLEAGRLFVNSRKRDLILRGGENVYPSEIEHCLEALPEVEEAAVYGVANEEFGQEVAAVVVPRAGAGLREEELREWVASRLAYFKVPSRWEIRADPLPRNASGKVLKDVLTGAAANVFRGD